MTSEKLRILVYDDQASVVDALRLLFDIHDIPVESATSADDLVRRLAHGQVGVVIQDMNFTPNETSGVEGMELFRSIRQVDSQVPVLLITAWACLENAVQLIKEGATDYISKPWDDDKLVTTVKNLLRLRTLQLENRKLQEERGKARRELLEKNDLCGLVYESDALHQVVTVALNVADSGAPILICGPSGSGKEKIAEIIQANSPRRDGPFVRVNLGAIPEELMESELFGAEAGAYTGLKSRTTGRFEAADGGTLFLDEIDSLSLAGQVKLLRVLQSGEFQRLGSSQTRSSDARIISATNANLVEAIAAGQFRQDLFYRLNVVELQLPPLGVRRDDVLPLARHFLAQFSAGKETPALTKEAQAALREYSWPGNVRELENRMQRAVLVGGAGEIDARILDLPRDEPAVSTNRTGANGSELSGNGSGAVGSPEEARQRRDIEQVLLNAEGIVARAAEELGLSRQALYRKMSRLGIVLERRPKS